ncbi:FtsX-like permease family protein [Chitinophaga costaii]|uniref:FtsX-like permease family protein n=1 Tax=Chitinophaga costaii TaxID=1335309 RepID=A0A1C4ACQ3_9BACT|nr:FtsX-like permease family protein [Chitinophaga costaii]PUZ26553.1 ABC transporter permease [Chitinophaga costaii]SCB92345.1 FtsX-like permease family protein [Chitinophaga costaii]
MKIFFQLLHKIIRTGVGRTRFVMAVLGLAIATLLMLVAVQTWADFEQLLYNQRNTSDSADFLVINKKVTHTNSADNQHMFSPAELADLQSQPFVKSAGNITSSQYKVAVAAPGNLQFTSEMFFEAVPDSFIDVQDGDWHWQAGNRLVPIILSNDFLNLYNYGFALSQGLPQLSPESVKVIPMQITISNGAHSEQFIGKVVGFSDRIASFLVPQPFMQWANANYGSGQPAATSRVIVKVTDPSNPALVKYLNDHDYTTNQDKLRHSRTKQVVQIIVSVIGFFGLVLLFFAMLVFSMFIQLIVASCRQEIALLVILGAAPGQLRRFLLRQFSPLYLITGVGALLLAAGLQYWTSKALQGHDFYVSPWVSVYTVLSALLIMAAVYVVNVRSIRKYVALYS